MSLAIAEYPSVEPVSLEQARLHLRLDADSSGHPDDDLIVGLIGAAREWAESFTGLVLAGTGYEMGLDAFPETITLPVKPVQSVEAITYLDESGAEQLVPAEDWAYNEDPFAPAIDLTSGAAWPTGTDVRVSFTAGYRPALDSTGLTPLPSSIRAALLLLIGHLYANRESTAERALTTIPMGVDSLLRPYRIRLGMA